MKTINISGHRLRDGHEVNGKMFLDDLSIGVLKKYLANCDRLLAARIIEIGFPVIKSIKFDAISGMTIDVSDYDDRDVSEFLHLARPLFLSDDRASFAKTMEVLGRANKDGAIRGHLRFLWGLYNRGDYAPYVKLSTADFEVFSDTMTQTWLNATEYHQDEEKEKIIKKIESALTPQAARSLFIAQLSGRIRAISKLKDLVTRVLSIAVK